MSGSVAAPAVSTCATSPLQSRANRQNDHTIVNESRRTGVGWGAKVDGLGQRCADVQWLRMSSINSRLGLPEKPLSPSYFARLRRSATVQSSYAPERPPFLATLDVPLAAAALEIRAAFSFDWPFLCRSSYRSGFVIDAGVLYRAYSFHRHCPATPTPPLWTPSCSSAGRRCPPRWW
jgi:hypothetical protein